MNTWARLRIAASFTQHELGGQAEVGRAKIANVETGRQHYTTDEQRRILAVLVPAITENLNEAAALLNSAKRG